MASHNDLGRWGERKAEEYLTKKGYSICHRNWKLGHRDLDLIALSPDGDVLVFRGESRRMGDRRGDHGTAIRRRDRRCGEWLMIRL